MTGPNPKFIFQALILIGSVFIFVIVLLVIKFKTGKTIRVLLSESKQLYTVSFAAIFFLIIILFIILCVLNN